MRARPLLIPALLCAACAVTTVAERADAATAEDASAKRTFGDVMLELDAHCTELERSLLGDVRADLPHVAATAQAAAALVRLGYGPHEWKDVPRFARLALECESWLLQIALEARQAHGDLAADLFRSGRTHHCSNCHDAVDRAKG